MSFLNDVIFPIDISAGSSGGPSYSTDVEVLSSGHESRNASWVNSRHSYNVGYGVRKSEQIESLLNIFHVANGMLHSFRFRDWTDYKSCAIDQDHSPLDQQIGVGDDVETQFQLIKTYRDFSRTKTRNITKPYDVLIAVDGIEVTSGWTYNNQTGIVTFSIAPVLAEVITAGYLYHVPVRFASDSLPIALETYKLGGADVQLVEVRE